MYTYVMVHYFIIGLSSTVMAALPPSLFSSPSYSINPSTPSITPSSTSFTTAPSNPLPPPVPESQNLGPLIGAIAGIGLIALIAVNVLVILLLYFCVCRKRKRGEYDTKSNNKEMITQSPLPAEPYYATPKTKGDVIANIAPYSETTVFIDEIDHNNDSNYNQIDSDMYTYINNSDRLNSMTQNGTHRVAPASEYQEIPERPLKKTERPKSVSPPVLAQNTMSLSTWTTNEQYASANQLDSSSPHGRLHSAEYTGSDFNIYAVPNIVPPPIPPSYTGSMFSIDLDPSLFTSRENLDDSMTTPTKTNPLTSVYSDPAPIQKTDVLEVTADNVKVISELGVGQFGKVLLAHTIGLSLLDLGLGNGQTSVSILVAVKVLQSDADDFEREAFEKEIKFMSRLKHENIVSILGVCLSRDAFIMMEYMENGDLNQYLQKFTFTPNQSTDIQNFTVDVGTLIYITLQIAGGMRYLASKNYVHRDLATRNCLVGQKFLVKIADFGMSRQLYDNSYYRIRGRAMLPIRWMAKECFYGRFSEKTDVWAYGVVAWEIFTICHSQPFEDMSDQDVIDNAISGPGRTLLEQPEACPDEVYQVMMQCWVDDPEQRATFEMLHGLLAQIHAYQ